MTSQDNLNNTAAGCLRSISILVALALFGPLFLCLGANVFFSSAIHYGEVEAAIAAKDVAPGTDAVEVADDAP